MAYKISNSIFETDYQTSMYLVFSTICNVIYPLIKYILPELTQNFLLSIKGCVKYYFPPKDVLGCFRGGGGGEYPLLKRRKFKNKHWNLKDCFKTNSTLGNF